jgi:hypothetical protein
LLLFACIPFLSVSLTCILFSSEDDDEVPLSKRAKILSEKAESAKESMPKADQMIALSPRSSVAKVPFSTVIPPTSTSIPSSLRDHVSILFSSQVSASPRVDNWLF